MQEKEFLDKMVDIMDTEEALSMDTDLSEVEEWDSLSYVAFLAYGTTVSKDRILPADVRAAKTVRDLYHLVTGDR